MRSYFRAARCPPGLRINNAYASSLVAHLMNEMSAASIPTTHPRTTVPAAVHRMYGSPRNKILKLLPPFELAAVAERSELVEVRSKQILFEPGDKLEHAHFPEDCVISLITVMEDGDQVEAMTVGNDGFSGIPVFHGVETSKHRGCGQITGMAARLAAKDFHELARELVGLRRLLHHYSEFVFETVAQSAACNRLHVIEQRCARWLLMSQDRG